MLFCPLCSNILLVAPDQGQTRFFCQTCPYVFYVKNKVMSKIVLTRKQVDSDVFGGDEAWHQAEQVEAECPFCKHKRAYIIKIQVNPLDQPKSSYYRCTVDKCAYQWSDTKR
ncbi:RNA polymerase III subunit [Tieghemostelium lacteum]|uniref:DNA-directed RNA polymerase subunit n=1 Tax=Tieghemostelium lacteum TaxID=361077 RepID=A0A152A371_TIELA|nr:RNA polymerase III subunit [Tieghemostelium lacteum]|eukprot:KYR00660.1 RNA polymerase III subunit [Tieghemostelium lacteum]